MAETYKLTYFDIRGRAEPARMMMSMAGQKFEDIRVASDEWAAKKAETPLGFLPILQTSEGTITQTPTIYMFLAGGLGFVPEGRFYRAQSSSIVITVNDLASFLSTNIYMSEVYKYFPTPDDIDQKKQACRDEISKVLKYIQSVGKKGSTFIFGDKITVADVALFCAAEAFLVVLPEVESEHAWLKSFMSSMKADSKVTKYLQERKPSPTGI